MATRLELHGKLEDLLGTNHVYYQPPESLKLEYPAIVYSKSDITKQSANNTGYYSLTRYEITVIDRRPDNLVIERLMELPYCAYDRWYAADNLNHDVLTLYF